jgi:EmrB/QacA subfamily drug resistance transporter
VTPPAHRPYVLAAAMATMFIAAVEGTIVATAMPTIVAKLGGFELFSWVFTSYLLSQAVTVPIYGRLADLYGRKRVLFVGIGLFLLGSVLCGLAWDMPSLILFRAVQGIGAGGILPVAMTIVGDLYTPAERAKIQGWLSGTWGVAALVGPWLGAVLVAHFSWALVFWINVPIGLIAVAMLAATLRESLEHRRHRIDYLGSALLGIGTVTLMSALVQAATLSAAAIALLVFSAAALLALFLFHEARTAEPMLPLRLWRNRVIAAGNVANLAFGAVMMGFIAFLPTYIEGVMGETAFRAAAILMTMSVSWSVGAIFTARLMMRTSYRTSATTGSVLLVTGSLMLAGLDTASGLVWLGAGAFLAGFGMGFISNSFVVAIQATVEWTERGVATSSVLFTRMIGQAVGTAVFGGILNAGVAALPGGAAIVNRIMEPALRQSLPLAENAALVAAIGAAVHRVFVINAVLAVAVLLVSQGLPAGLSPVRAAHARKPSPRASEERVG